MNDADRLAGWTVTGPRFKDGDHYLSKDGDNPEAPWPKYGWPLGSECWYYLMEGFDRRFYATGLTPEQTAAPAPAMQCTRCGSPAEFRKDEGVWRHAEPAHLVICDRYGYPIQVRPGLDIALLKGLCEDWRRRDSVIRGNQTLADSEFIDTIKAKLPLLIAYIESLERALAEKAGG